jgi:hypothetical protein
MSVALYRYISGGTNTAQSFALADMKTSDFKTHGSNTASHHSRFPFLN